jgi:quercetin dioxygenase-like cupin family protein
MILAACQLGEEVAKVHTKFILPSPPNHSFGCRVKALSNGKLQITRGRHPLDGVAANAKPPRSIEERGSRRMNAIHAWNIAGVEVQVLVSSHDTGGRCAICEIRTAGRTGAPLHAHNYEDGFFYILEGEFQFWVGEKTFHKPARSSLYIPRQTAYAFQGNGDGGRFLIFVQPGGLDLFFQDVDAALQGKMPDLPTLLPLLEKHGIALFTRLEAKDSV